MHLPSPRLFTAICGMIAGLSWGMSSSAIAQCPTCGPTISASSESKCGHCGLIPTPIFDKLFIKKHCVPTICPGSCFGHFQTKWTPWPAACPQWQAGVVGYDPNLVHQYPPAGIRTNIEPEKKIPAAENTGPGDTTPKDLMPKPRPVPPRENETEPKSLPPEPKSKGL